MLSRRMLGTMVWVDLESPTQTEVRSLMGEFGLDAVVAEELLLPTVRPRFEMHPHFMYVVLHFPALRHSHKAREQELDFIVGKDFIITTRYDAIDSLHKFAKVFEVSSMLDKNTEQAHGGLIFYYMAKKMYKAVEHEISSVRDALVDIENNVFKGHEREMVAALSQAGRDLLDLRQAIEPHRDVLHEIEAYAPGFFGSSFGRYMKNLANEYYRVHNHIVRHQETLHELRATNNSLLTTKQNEVIKILTVMAFITFPLSVIAAIFGMNVDYMPIAHHENGFWIVLGIMAVVGISMFIYFKRKKWL